MIIKGHVKASIILSIQFDNGLVKKKEAKNRLTIDLVGEVL